MYFYIKMVSFSYRCLKAYTLYNTDDITVSETIHNIVQKVLVVACQVTIVAFFCFWPWKKGKFSYLVFYSCSNPETFLIQLVFLSALQHDNVYRRTQTGTLDFLGRYLGSWFRFDNLVCLSRLGTYSVHNITSSFHLEHTAFHILR